MSSSKCDWKKKQTITLSGFCHKRHDLSWTARAVPTELASLQMNLLTKDDKVCVSYIMDVLTCDSNSSDACVWKNSHLIFFQVKYKEGKIF